MEWQKIETAPRDGTQILVCYTGYPQIPPKVVSWQKWPFNRQQEEWGFFEGPAINGLDHNPDYWAAIPPIPVTAIVPPTHGKPIEEKE
jgi:hypothetical protein